MLIDIRRVSTRHLPRLYIGRHAPRLKTHRSHVCTLAGVSCEMPSEAFQVVVERYTADVWRFCASQVGVDRADECYQETMLAALEGYPRLRKPDAARSWLLRIAARKAIDLHRARARAPVPRAELDRGPSSDAAGPPDASVLGLVASLPQKQRTAIAYRFVVDLAYNEIATLMGTSEEAARRNVHEGLKALRAQLASGAPPAGPAKSRRSHRR